MTGAGYLILGYVPALGLMWGYATTVWLNSRKLRSRAGEPIELDSQI